MFPFTATRIPLIYTVKLSADRPLARRFEVRGITTGQHDSALNLTALRHFHGMPVRSAMRLPF